MMVYKYYNKTGFTLIEVLIGTAVFLMVVMAAYGLFTNLFRLALVNQANIIAVQLADEQFEIIRNMPYVNVGLTNGIPLGVLPKTQTLTRGNFIFIATTTIRNVNLSTSAVQASDKLIEIEIGCPLCKNFNPLVLTGQISPANLQNAANGGALVVQTFDANGQPVQGATVYVQSVSTSTITNTDVTNNSGILNIIGIPQGVNAYQIIVSKPGYSTDRTYAIGAPGNINPTKPNFTVLNGQASQASFAIDRLSSLDVKSVTPLCVAVPSYHFNLKGMKQIGASLPKYDQNLTTGSTGSRILRNMEWDTYTVTPTDTVSDIAGMNPNSPLTLNPNNAQDIQLTVVPKSPNSLMVSVIDPTTRLPVSGAVVSISKGSVNTSKTTGSGYISQTDWSGGDGQVRYTAKDRYFVGNDQVDTATSSGDILLREVDGLYDTTIPGVLESSTFDIGTSSNFYTLSWSPNNQPLLTGINSVKFQFATNPTSTSASWTYLGPDGTPDTYYTVPGATLNSIHNNDRFVRYKVYLRTETATSTPSVSDVSFSYTSSCLPPGQVLFQGLSVGTYDVTVSVSGYAVYTASVTVDTGWQESVVPMAAN